MAPSRWYQQSQQSNLSESRTRHRLPSPSFARFAQQPIEILIAA